MAPGATCRFHITSLPASYWPDLVLLSRSQVHVPPVYWWLHLPSPPVHFYTLFTRAQSPSHTLHTRPTLLFTTCYAVQPTSLNTAAAPTPDEPHRRRNHGTTPCRGVITGHHRQPIKELRKSCGGYIALATSHPPLCEPHWVWLHMIEGTPLPSPPHLLMYLHSTTPVPANQHLPYPRTR